MPLLEILKFHMFPYLLWSTSCRTEMKHHLLIKFVRPRISAQAVTVQEEKDEKEEKEDGEDAKEDKKEEQSEESKKRKRDEDLAALAT